MMRLLHPLYLSSGRILAGSKARASRTCGIGPGLFFAPLFMKKKWKKEKPFASKLLSYVSLLRNENSISCAFAGPLDLAQSLTHAPDQITFTKAKSIVNLGQEHILMMTAI